jgi:hypothetical protein
MHQILEKLHLMTLQWGSILDLIIPTCCKWPLQLYRLQFLSNLCGCYSFRFQRQFCVVFVPLLTCFLLLFAPLLASWVFLDLLTSWIVIHAFLLSGLIRWLVFRLLDFRLYMFCSSMQKVLKLLVDPPNLSILFCAEFKVYFTSHNFFRVCTGNRWCQHVVASPWKRRVQGSYYFETCLDEGATTQFKGSVAPRTQQLRGRSRLLEWCCKQLTSTSPAYFLNTDAQKQVFACQIPRSPNYRIRSEWRLYIRKVSNVSQCCLFDNIAIC